MADELYYRILNSIKYFARQIDFIRREFKSSTVLPFSKSIWLWRNGFFRKSYILYSLDSECIKNYVSDYSSHVKTPAINGFYGEILNNKLIFYQVLRPYIKWLTEIYCYIKKGSVFNVCDSIKLETYDDVIDLCNKLKRIVIKPITGYGGNNVYLIKSGHGALWINESKVTLSDLKHFLTKRDDYFVCDYVQQHQYAANIFPDVANAIRILTMWDHEKKESFIAAAAHRIGRVHTIPVDNWSKGGLYSSIDLATGVLGKGASYSGGSELLWYGTHPDTHSQIEGVIVPRWQEVKTKLLEIAQNLPYLPYVGWDVVLTEESFKILEGNPWPGLNLQIHSPLLLNPRVKAFYKRYNMI